MLTMNPPRSTTAFLSGILVWYILNSTAKTIATLPNSTGNIPLQQSTNNATFKENVTHVRKMVRLTMKQGLVMNQIINTYSISKPESEQCRVHTEEFKNALRALEPWALQMFDSSSKMQSSILMGNMVEYGAFRQCLNIYKDIRENGTGAIRGKHCVFRIKPGPKLVRTVLGYRNVTDKRYEQVKDTLVDGIKLIWSVCVPDSCPVTDIFRHFNKTIMELVEGLDVHVALLEERNCETLAKTPKIETGELVFLLMVGTVILAVAFCSGIDLAKGGECNQFVKIFSAISNGRLLVAESASGGTELNCLHGIRFISVCHVLYGHRFLTGMVFPSANSLYLLEWAQKYSSTLVIGGTICVDTFLLISGLLVAYGFFEHVMKTNRFNLGLFYLYRYLRITPPLAVVVGFYAFSIQHLGSGPLWRDTYESMQKPCRYFWWSTLLHVQNYANPSHLCIPQTWYLSCEVVYYCAAPAVLYPLWKWPVLGYANLAFLYVLSVTINFYLAWVNEYAGGMPLTTRLFDHKYFQKHYIATHVRASPYIIGLAIGYVLFKTKGRQFKMSYPLIISGWLVSISLLAAPILGSHVFEMENHVYNRLESSLFLSCSRSAWSMGIVWIIWACVQGYGGIVNDILSWHGFRIAGRISYFIFLLHVGFQFLREGAAKTPPYFSTTLMLYQFCADLLFTSICGLLFSLLFEYPCMGINAFLMRLVAKHTKIIPMQPTQPNP